MLRRISEVEWNLINQFRAFEEGRSDRTPFSLLNSSRRSNWIISRLKEFREGGRILDAGAGQCQYRDACAHLKYTSQDINEYSGEGGEGLHVKGWDFSGIDVCCDIVNMPFADEEFDYVMCTEVLEHVPDAVAALKEMARILKSGGEILITSPFCSLTHFAPYHYATGFSRYFYEIHLRKLGFEIKEMMPNGNFFEFVGQEIERISEMKLTYAERADSGQFSKFYIESMICIMDGMAAVDNGSDRLLTFGYHVLATKR